SKEPCLMSDALLPDQDKTKEQLLEEVRTLRRRLHALERPGGPPVPPLVIEGFLAPLLDHAPAPVHVTSAVERYLLVNRAAEERWGVGRGEVLGGLVSEVFPPERAARLGAANRRVLETGAPVTAEEFADGARGRRFFHTVKFPLCGADGRVEAVGDIA